MSPLKEAIKRSELGPAQITAPDTITRRYCFPDGFPGFSGHFPGYPILPAVVQLIAAQCLIEEHIGHPVNPGAVLNAKFLQEIRPGMEILIQCTDCQVKGLPGQRIQILSGDRVASSFLVTFQDEGDEGC